MNLKLLGILVGLGLLMFGVALTLGQKVPPPSHPTASQGDFSALLNKAAPDFSLSDQNGKTFKLSGQHGKKVVLFFNEGIMCYPACWDQIAELGKDARLNTSNITSASIVTDQRSAWDSAMKKMPDLAKGTILYDTDKNVSTEYGVMSLESSMHRGSMPGHTYIIIDPQGIVRYTNDDPAMGIHNQELLDQINKI